MLDMEVEELKGDDETRDTLCEIGNIIGGNLKSAFADVGLACVLSTPSFTTGTDFKTEALNMEKYERFAFRSDQSVVFVEMGLKISELVMADSQNGKDIQDSDGDVASKEDTTQAQQAVKEEKQNDSIQPPAKNPEDVDLDLLLDIPLEIKVELGRAKVPIHKLLNFGPGSAVKLLKLEGEPVDILANDTLIAKGEVVVQNQKYGIRVLEITSRLDRIRGFRM
jgi:flagellar motor switch protein FliN